MQELRDAMARCAEETGSEAKRRRRRDHLIFENPNEEDLEGKNGEDWVVVYLREDGRF